jgi:DNA-binding transcriptional LysR family regulator
MPHGNIKPPRGVRQAKGRSNFVNTPFTKSGWSAVMLPDLDSLLLFLRAAEMRSLTKAAESTHMVVGAASRRIARLEHEFKARLLVRTRKGVDLTAAGKLLEPEARQLIEKVYAMKAAVAAHVAGRAQFVSLFANAASVTWFLPVDLAEFREKHANCHVAVEERSSHEVVEAVRNGDADIGIFTEGPLAAGLRCLPYRADHLAAIVQPDHPLTGGEVTFERILGFDLVTLETGSGLTRLLEQKSAAMGRPLSVKLHMKSFQSVCRMVKSGMGVGVLPMMAVREIADFMKLRSIPLEDEWARRPLLLGMRANVALRPAVSEVANFLATTREAG